MIVLNDSAQRCREGGVGGVRAGWEGGWRASAIWQYAVP